MQPMRLGEQPEEGALETLELVLHMPCAVSGTQVSTVVVRHRPYVSIWMCIRFSPKTSMHYICCLSPELVPIKPL
jgi:hypothetical protein